MYVYVRMYVTEILKIESICFVNFPENNFDIKLILISNMLYL